MNDPNVATRMEPIPEVKGTHDSSVAARSVAKSLVQGVQGAEPDTAQEPQQGLPYETTVQEPQVEPAVEAEPQAVQEPAAEEVELDPFQADNALLDTLAEMGVELGVDPETIPPELMPQFNALAKAAVIMADQIIEKDTEVEDLRIQQAELSQQIQQDPTKFLLAMMLTYPEQFQEVVAVAQQAEADDSVKQRVYRELEAEAKYREAVRRERVVNHREKMQKARQLTYLTRQAAKRYGIDSRMAEETVATHIKASGGDLDIGQVDGIVRGIRNAPKRQAFQQHTTPKHQAAQKTAPGPTPGSDAPSAATPQESRRSGLQSPIRKIIGDSFRKAMGGS